MLPITSRSNPRLKLLRAAFEGRRQNDGLVALEGPHLIEEALRSGTALQTLFVSQSAERSLQALLETPQLSNVETFTVAEGVFASAVATEHSQGIAALFQPQIHAMPPLHGCLFVIVESLQDPGNLGTILRSAEAFGAAAVLTLPGTADVWNQKTIRASAGSVFRIPVIAGTLQSVADLQREGLNLIAAVARGGSTPAATNFTGPCALLIGNEGAGLSAKLLAMSEHPVTIHCPGRVESLNAAVATSVLLYAASLQRQVL